MALKAFIAPLNIFISPASDEDLSHAPFVRVFAVVFDGSAPLGGPGGCVFEVSARLLSTDTISSLRSKIQAALPARIPVEFPPTTVDQFVWLDDKGLL